MNKGIGRKHKRVGGRTLDHERGGVRGGAGRVGRRAVVHARVPSFERLDCQNATAAVHVTDTNSGDILRCLVIDCPLDAYGLITVRDDTVQGKVITKKSRFGPGNKRCDLGNN